MANVILNKRAGFTLIEVVLYTGLAAIIITLTAGMAVMGLQARAKATAVNEVEQEAARAVDIVTQLVRNAESVTVNGSTISLTMPTAADSPTVITLAGGNITVSRGGNAARAVTSDTVTVSSFTVADRSYANTPGTIDMAMTVQANAAGNRAEFTYEATHHATVSLRQ